MRLADLDHGGRFLAIRTLERVDRRAARSNHMGLLSNDGRSRVSALSYTAASCRCPTRDGRPDRRGIATSRARTQVGFYSSGTAGTRREVALRPDGRWRGERQHAALIDGFQTRSGVYWEQAPGMCPKLHRVNDNGLASLAVAACWWSIRPQALSSWHASSELRHNLSGLQRLPTAIPWRPV